MRRQTQFLKEGYLALQDGDLERFKALAKEHLGPEFEFHHVWDGTVFKGYEGTLEWLSDTADTWAEYHQELEEIVERGDDVVVTVRISARGGGSGVPVAQEFATVWTFKDGRAVLARSYGSKAEALEAAGSSS